MKIHQYNDGQVYLVNSNIRSYAQRGDWNGQRYYMSYSVALSDIDSEQIICVKAASIQREIKIKHVKTQNLIFYISDTIYHTQTSYGTTNPLVQRNPSSTITSGDYYIYTVVLPENKYLYITYQSGSSSGGTTYPWYVNTYSRANPTEVYIESSQLWSDLDLKSYATGINEFDPNNLDAAPVSLSTVGSATYVSSSSESVRIPCKKNTTYNVGFSLPSAKNTLWRVFYTDSENYPTSGSAITGTTVVKDSASSVTSKSTTFTTSNTAKYIWFQVSYTQRQDIYPYIYVQKESGWYPSEDVHLFDNNIWS